MKHIYWKTVVLGMGYFGVSAAWAMYNALVPIFLASRFKLGPAQIGLIMALDNVAALLIQPPVGAWSDRIKTPLGRRLPFVLVGAPVAAAILGVIPAASALPLFLASAIGFLLSMAFWRAPFFTLLADLIPSARRSQANGIINAIGVTGAMVAFFLGARLYTKNPAYPFWMGAGLLLFTAGLVMLFLREKSIPGSPAEQRDGILTILRKVARDPDRSVLRIMFAILLVFVSNNALDTFVTLYAVNHLGLTAADGSRLMGQFTVLFVLFAIPSGLLGARAGRNLSICAGMTIMAAATLVQYFLPPAQLVQQFGALPLIGVVRGVSLTMMLTAVGWCIVHTNSLPMVLDMTTPAYVGAYVGLYYLFSTLGAIIGPIANGWIIELAGRNYNVMLLFGPVLLLCAVVLMRGVRGGEAARPAPVPA
jgi:maltose/moltooligosaccharide transporter